MKKDKAQARYDRSRLAVKIIAGILAVIMVAAVAASLVFAIV